MRFFHPPGDMGPKVGVVIASSGSCLPTDAADVGLFPSVHLQQGSFFAPIFICYELPSDGRSDNNSLRTSYGSAHIRNSCDEKNMYVMWVNQSSGGVGWYISFGLLDTGEIPRHSCSTLSSTLDTYDTLLQRKQRDAT